MSGLGNKEFIHSLMPRHPIYIPLLPESAREVIGKVHRNAEAALGLCLGEGFERTDEVDIFDAGPMLRGDFEKLRTVRLRKTFKVGAVGAEPKEGNLYLAGNDALDFRACLTIPEFLDDGSVKIDGATASVLAVAEGEDIDLVPASGGWRDN